MAHCRGPAGPSIHCGPMNACVVPATVSYFPSGGALRSRSVGDAVLAGQVELPALPVRLLADWSREARESLDLQPGDVEVLPLARARSRWPDFRLCVAQARHWLAGQGLAAELLDDADMALMTCLGARYHHDGAQYGGAAFFNLFVSDDLGLDLHFAATGRRIALARGTAVVFDPCQPHAVVPRGSAAFDPLDFAPGRDRAQYFLTWELPIEHAALAALLGVAFDVDPDAASVPEAQLRLGGAAAELCPASGCWKTGASTPAVASQRAGSGA